MGLIEVVEVPKLVPFLRSRNCFDESLAPPVGMRGIWIGKQFDAEMLSSGFYHWVPDKDKPVKIIRGGFIINPAKLVSSGDVSASWKFGLDYQKGIELLRKDNVGNLVLKWYESRWPEEADFVFDSNEISDLEYWRC